MQIGMVGLGRMGANISRRLMRAGHEVVAFDINTGAVDAVAQDGAVGVASLDELVARLAAPRAVWIMLPHGKNTENSLQVVAQRLERGDIVIDGGNSHFHDDVRRAAELSERGIRYLDVGTSGGVHGLERGYCLMIGGDVSAFETLDPIFSALAPGRDDISATGSRQGFDRRAEQGYLYCGPAGAGHFVKMIHNGIEYGMMQALAEGFDIMRNAGKPNLPEAHRYDLNLADVAEVWRRGSVVSSWLLDLTAEALAENPTLSGFSGVVEDSGEGRWTVQAAIDEAVPAEVLTAALFARFRSRQDHTFAEKVLSAMRYKFGGHVEKPA